MAHEFGHGLGLLHSVDKHSIMKAYYAGYDKDFKLGQDDITAAQMIYGRYHPVCDVRVSRVIL